MSARTVDQLLAARRQDLLDNERDINRLAAKLIELMKERTQYEADIAALEKRKGDD